ncbi:MAG: ABC transporter permease [Archaeoglobaceae archaeon]
MSDLQAIYVLLMRDVKKFVRIKSRLIGSLGMPIFFLVFLSLGFRRAYIPSLPAEVNYSNFVVPGIVAMVLLFSSIFSGVSVVWDRQFGFLREIIVSPASRTAIVIGRTLGGSITAILQAFILLSLSYFIGFNFQISKLPIALFVMFLISLTFTSLGILFSVFMRDVHGFQIIMNFFVFPVFLISGSLFPISELPPIVKELALLNPLTYGVDALRWSTIGFTEVNPFLDFLAIFISCICFIMLAAYFFGKTEVE